MNGNTARLTAGEKPPETVEHEGKTWRPVWREVTTDSDRRRGEVVWIIVAMGHPVDDDDTDSAPD